jgi:hypothetical protein
VTVLSSNRLAEFRLRLAQGRLVVREIPNCHAGLLPFLGPLHVRLLRVIRC